MTVSLSLWSRRTSPDLTHVENRMTIKGGTGSYHNHLLTMAQAYVEQYCLFEYMELAIDEDHYVRVSRKEGQPVLGIYRRTKHGRLGLQLTLEQFQQLLDMTESIQLALSLIGPK